jgi:hypothetical protein
LPLPEAPELIVNQPEDPFEAVHPQFEPFGVTVMTPEPADEPKRVLLLLTVKLHPTPA